MDHPEMRNTAFGKVLAGLLEKRGREVTPSQIDKISEEAGILAGEVLVRMAEPPRVPSPDLPYLDSLAWGLGNLDVALDLTDEEKASLAHAFAFEEHLD